MSKKLKLTQLNKQEMKKVAGGYSQETYVMDENVCNDCFFCIIRHPWQGWKNNKKQG